MSSVPLRMPMRDFVRMKNEWSFPRGCCRYASRVLMINLTGTQDFLTGTDDFPYEYWALSSNCNLKLHFYRIAISGLSELPSTLFFGYFNCSKICNILYYFILTAYSFEKWEKINTHLAGQTYVWHCCKWNVAWPQIYLQPAKIKSQHFGVSLKVLVCDWKYCIWRLCVKIFHFKCVFIGQPVSEISKFLTTYIQLKP